MASVQEHYDRHLGPVYRWMVGDVAGAMERSQAELRSLGVSPAATRIAVDLGAGVGLHSIPLARLGFDVVAVEASAPMIAELRREIGTLRIELIEGDLRSFREHAPGAADAIVCMGDTLTHLPSEQAVAQLLDDVATTLTSSGVFITTFRDYTGAGLTGNARFIPVRADDTRILTCFLEYAEHTITVHDLLHDRRDGAWQLQVSSYPKIRLDPSWVAGRLQAAGLIVERGTAGGGMVRIVARGRERAGRE